jgi:hypothetical protein
MRLGASLSIMLAPTTRAPRGARDRDARVQGRTGRVNDTSGGRSSSMSPFTPRSCGS